MSDFTIATDYSVISCGECGISFCVPVGWLRKRKNSHEGWCCPNGHNRVFSGESKAERLERELEHQCSVTTHLRDQLDSTKRSRDSYKGKLTRTNKRIANGVCPCCNRTFKDLARHMKGQHPKYEAKT